MVKNYGRNSQVFIKFTKNDVTIDEILIIKIGAGS